MYCYHCCTVSWTFQQLVTYITGYVKGLNLKQLIYKHSTKKENHSSNSFHSLWNAAQLFSWFILYKLSPHNLNISSGTATSAEGQVRPRSFTAWCNNFCSTQCTVGYSLQCLPESSGKNGLSPARSILVIGDRGDCTQPSATTKSHGAVIINMAEVLNTNEKKVFWVAVTYYSGTGGGCAFSRCPPTNPSCTLLGPRHRTASKLLVLSCLLSAPFSISGPAVMFSG